MKKLRTVIYVLLFTCLLFFIGVRNFKASETPVIDHFYSDITVLENGDLKVKELIVLNGKYNGFERVINYKNEYAPVFDGTESSFEGSDIYNGDQIILSKIAEVKIPNKYDFSLIKKPGQSFQKVNSASNGSKRKYVATSSSNGQIYRMYNKNNSGSLGFYLEYTVKNVAIRHNDIAEVGWNLMGNELSNRINHYEAYIHIPNNQKELRAWAHGPLNGNVELVNRKTIKITVSDIYLNTSFDTRFVFDLNVIFNSTKTTNITALPIILNVETKKADEANQMRDQLIDKQIQVVKMALDKVETSLRPSDLKEVEKQLNILSFYTTEGEYPALQQQYKKISEQVEARMTTLKWIFGSISILYMIAMVIYIYYIYLKYDKELKVNHIEYFRDIPNDYGPACVDYLFKRKIDNHSFSATLLNLISDKVISYEKIDKKNYKLTYHDNVRTLFEEEEKLITWIFKGKEDGKETTLDTFKKQAKTYSTFLSDYERFKTYALKHARSLNFYEVQNLKGIPLLASLLGIILGMLCIYFEVGLLFIIYFIVGIASLIYFVSIQKKTKFGREEYEKWNALKRFLKDFGKFDTKDLPDMILWQKFLVYAYVFGCADELEKTMKIKVAEMGDVPMTGYYYDPTFTDMLIFSHIMNRTINSSFSSAYSARSAASSGNYSSGGGFGGGFSSGGGSFGGGGGGGSF